MRLREVDISSFFAEVVKIGNSIGANSSGVTEEKLQPLSEMLGKLEPSKAYIKLQVKVAEEMEEWLEGVDWDDINSQFTADSCDESGVFLQSVANAQTAIARKKMQEISGVPIDLTFIPVKWSDDIGTLKGKTLFSPKKLNPEKDRIFLNETLTSLTERAGEAMITVSHESWHLVNVALGQAVRDGVLKEEHPLYHDGLYYMHQMDRNAHYTVGTAYKSGLDERTATHFGDRIGWWVQQNIPSVLHYVYDETGPVFAADEVTEQPAFMHS